LNAVKCNKTQITKCNGSLIWNPQARGSTPLSQVLLRLSITAHDHQPHRHGGSGRAPRFRPPAVHSHRNGTRARRSRGLRFTHAAHASRSPRCLPACAVPSRPVPFRSSGSSPRPHPTMCSVPGRPPPGPVGPRPTARPALFPVPFFIFFFVVLW